MRHDPGRTWWHDAVIYEIYPRSFADADGDGEGDLAGLVSRLPYLAELGVDAIWVAPWYPSPLADGGYDVSDYRDIHPLLGTLADAEGLVAAAHDHGLRVIIDLVANHTSAEHPWFAAATLDAGSAERDRYFFRDGRGADGDLPPNNWISAFGGSAWSRAVDASGTPGQWYLHTFAPEQPDLDWTDSDVVAEFDDILRFWLDRGVDGFRVDAAPAMGKAPGLPDADYGDTSGFAASDWGEIPHWDVDAVHATFRRWRLLLDGYPGDRVFVAEAVVNGAERLARYLRPDELHTAFTFDYLHASWDAAELRQVIDATRQALQPLGSPPTWALSSHDEIRHVSRFGRSARWSAAGDGRGGGTDLERGTRRARAAVLLTLALPGSAYLYQGEELGLPEVDDLPDEVLQDPVFTRTGGRARGRDGCRVPLPWSGDEPPYGFSPARTSTWLPQPTSWAALTVEAQLGDPGSMLHLYRSALALRRRLAAAPEVFAWLETPDLVLGFERGDGWRCIVNFGPDPHPLDATPTLASGPLLRGVLLPTDTAAWLLSVD